MEKSSLDKKSPIKKSQEPEGALQAKMEGKQPPQFKLDASSKGAENTPQSVQSEVGSAFGADFSDVNIHENSGKASDVGALAFTQGNDVHFAPGQFQPESKAGKELIGHEFAHVQQQRQGNVEATKEVNGVGVNDSADLENKADVAGAQFAQSGKVASLGAAAGAAAGGAVQAKEDPLKVQQGQVTFDAEGQDSGPYFSRVCHWPGGNSGVTIGRGYDLGSRTAKGVLAHLTAAGITGSQASLLSQGAGLKGQAAGDWVKANKAKVGEITHAQQKLLFDIVYAEHKDDVVRLSTKKDVVESYGAVDFKNLHPAIMEIMVDLRYRGDYHSRSRKWIQPIVVKNDLKAFAAAMADSKWLTEYGVPKARFESRKSFMAAAAAGKTPPKAPSVEPPKKGETAPGTGGGATENTTVIDSGAVTASSLNVRAGAGANFGKVGNPLVAGATVKVYEKKDGWLRIGKGQWVSAGYVKLTGVTSEKTDTTKTPAPPAAAPTETGTVATSALNVRSGPGTDSKVLRTLKSGEKVQIFEKKDGWLRIGTGEWTSAKFVTISSTPAPAPVPKKETGIVTANTLNVRAEGNGNAKVVGQLQKGASVDVLSEKNGWINIGAGRWVSASYVSIGGKTTPAPAPTPGGGGSGKMPSWVSLAQSEVGQKEIKGSKHNSRIVEYQQSTPGKFQDDETAWCSSFMNWVMKKAGKGGTNSAMAMSWANWGKKLDKPALGSIVVFSYGGGKGHVGLVVGKQGSNLQVLGGNQSDSVKVSSFSTSKVVAYVVPSDYEVPAANYNLTQGAEVEDSGGFAGTR